MIAPRTLYTWLVYLMAPRMLLRLWRRARREPGYRRHIGERFGRYRGAAPSDCVWLHAVSVGETRAAQPIVERLLALDPHRRVILTHMTPTGRDAGRELYGDRVLRFYLPYDFPWAVRRFVRHFKPQVGLIMETEVWPNLIQACREGKVPIFLVNARLSEKSYRGYSRLGRIAKEALNGLECIAAQSEADAARFRELGASRVHVTGNVKFDVAPSDAMVSLGHAWRDAVGSRPILVAASTRDGEEAMLLDELPAVEPPNLLTVIVPRHPQRFDDVARLLEARGITYARRSAALPDARTRVWLGDSMGEMVAYLAAADVAFIGGSLRPFGAHNLLEACALAKPVIIGPSVYNFREAVELGIAAGAVVQVKDAKSLAWQASALLSDPGRASVMGRLGAEFARTHRGAVDRLFTLLDIDAARR